MLLSRAGQSVEAASTSRIPITQRTEEVRMLSYLREHDPMGLLANRWLDDSVDAHEHRGRLTDAYPKLQTIFRRLQWLRSGFMSAVIAHAEAIHISL